MVNTVSDEGIAFSKSWEKWRAMPYKDQANLGTIGWGHLIRQDENFDDGITQEQGDALFLQDMARKAVEPVLRVLGPDLPQQQFDALVDFTFNDGEGALYSSHLAALVKGGDFTPEQILAEFEKWRFVHVNGQPVESAGLLARRRAEADIFNNGNYVNHA